MKLHCGLVLLIVGVITPWASALAATDSEPPANQAWDVMQTDLALAADTQQGTVQLAAEQTAKLDARLFVLDFFNFVNSVRLADLGYAAQVEDALRDWQGALTYRAQFDAQSGRLDFNHGVQLELGYTKQLNDTLTVGISILGGTGNLPGDGDFGFTDPELQAAVELDTAWAKLSLD